MELAEVLAEIQTCFDDPPGNEANTCDLVIRPLLLALGYSPREINREAHDQAGNRPDYSTIAGDRRAAPTPPPLDIPDFIVPSAAESQSNTRLRHLSHSCDSRRW